MSEQRNTRRILCERFASLLAALDPSDTNFATNTPEMAEARAHLVGCPYCQANQRDYAALDGAVRAAFGPATVAPFRTADLLMAVGATSEPQSRRAGDPIRSVRYLKDFDDTEGHTTMHDTDERANNDTAPATTRTPPLSVRLPRGASLRRQALTLGFSATAAAVILIVVAVSLFGAHWRPNVAHSRLAHTMATQTTSLPATAGAGIAAISMDSPIDGWALGDATLDPTVTPTNVGVAFYHYDGHVWRFAQRIGGLVIYQNSAARIHMFSPTDGWAYIPSSTAPLHYDGNAWKPAPITLTSAEQLSQLVGFDMVSPTEGWAAAYLMGGSAGPGAIEFLHYDGKKWTVEEIPFAPSDIDLRSTVISGFSSAPGVVWAVGWATRPNQSGDNPPVGLLFKRYNDSGIWNYYQQGNSGTGIPSTALHDVVMTSPSSGWMVGETVHTAQQSNGMTTDTASPLLLRYDFAATGPRWQPVPVHVDGPGIFKTLLRIEAIGERNIWIAGSSGSTTRYSSTSEISSLLLHYDGATWTSVTPILDTGPNMTATITTLALAPNGDLWVAGQIVSVTNTYTRGPIQPFFWRYHDGVWSAATVETT